MNNDLELLSARNAQFDPAEFEQRYLAIMIAANKKWVEIKEG